MALIRRRSLAAGILVAVAVSTFPSFAAEPAAPPAVVLVGDTQRTGFLERLVFREQNDGPRAAVMREIASEDPALVVILGDLVASGGSSRAWDRFDHFTAPLRSRAIRTVAILGNHDYMGSRRTMRAAVAARFPLLATRSWGVARAGRIALVLLDSNFARLGDDATRDELGWYEAQLAALDRDPEVRFVVVCCHHPPYTNSKVVSPSAAVRDLLVPPFLAARKTVLFASGHCHSYEHFRVGGKDFVVTGGGGGPRQRVETDRGRRRFDDLYAGPGIRDFNFCRLDPAGDRLQVAMVGLDPATGRWSVRDRFEAVAK